MDKNYSSLSLINSLKLEEKKFRKKAFSPYENQ